MTSQPEQLELEAVIRAALGETDLDLSAIRPLVRFKMENAIFGFACRKLGVDEAAANALILESEQIAVQREFNPPLAIGS